MQYRAIMWSATAVAISGLWSAAPANADDRPKTGATPRPAAVSSAEALPACLQKLTLTAPQQKQINTIIGEYDADIAAVQKQFGERYMEAIRTEAALLAAIEDNLTDSQRKQVRDERRKTARHQKAMAGTATRPNQAVSKVASAVESELVIVGVSLTPEQEAKADMLQEKCLNHLRSLHRDIQGLHTRLVSLEADKLVEIETVLTPEQLQQLRDNRQETPIEPHVAARQPAQPSTN